jgi:ABC-type multidrug transport system fused ATPase/permease subunit
MEYFITLPMELQSVIGSEKVDFTVLAKRNQPLKKSIGLMIFGMVWTAFTSIFVIAFLGPLFIGKETHFTVNGVPTTGSWDNFQPMLVPTLIIGVFVLVGIGMLGWGIYATFQKGGYFVGTAHKLIHYYKGNIRTYDWEQFSGNMEINHTKGDLAMQLRTGKMVTRKNSSDQFVPDVIYISGANNILEIEKICSKRIKENDPTPVNTSIAL